MRYMRWSWQEYDTAPAWLVRHVAGLITEEQQKQGGAERPPMNIRRPAPRRRR
jgi:hypothetical protein